MHIRIEEAWRSAQNSGDRYCLPLDFGSGAGNVSRQRLPRGLMFSRQFGGGYKPDRGREEARHGAPGDMGTPIPGHWYLLIYIREKPMKIKAREASED
jgi:hypothetical protein